MTDLRPRAAQGQFASWGHRSLAEVEPRRYTPAATRAYIVVQLREQKIPYKEIARRIGITPQGVHWIARKARLKARGDA